MKKSRLESLAVLAAIALAWQRFGLKVPALGQVTRDTPLRPDGTCPAGWIKLGNKCIRL